MCLSETQSTVRAHVSSAPVHFVWITSWNYAHLINISGGREGVVVVGEKECVRFLGGGGCMRFMESVDNRRFMWVFHYPWGARGREGGSGSSSPPSLSLSLPLTDWHHPVCFNVSLFPPVLISSSASFRSGGKRARSLTGAHTHTHPAVWTHHHLHHGELVFLRFSAGRCAGVVPARCGNWLLLLLLFWWTDEELLIGRS